MEKRHVSRIQYQKPFSYLIFLNTFTKWYLFLKKSQYWTKDQIEEYQIKKLKELVSHTYSNVPYYQTALNKKTVKPSQINKLSDLSKLPCITRKDIQKNSTNLKAVSYPNNAFKRTMTGGTTGTPLKLYVEKARWLGIHFAFNKIYMDRAQYQWTDKVISLTGITDRYRYHPFLRTLELSSFHTTKKDLDEYFQKITRFKPRFITSYPSALTLFTQYLQNTHKTPPSTIKAIFLHGETVFNWQRKLIEEFFDCPVFDQYGHREQCAFATTCEKNNQYHVYPEYGIVEIIDEQGNLLTKKGEQGEIIATSLTNNIFPLIRYKTGDIAIIGDETCECGRQHLLLDRLLGRSQEFLLNSKKDRIPVTGLYHVIAEYASHVKECQLIQERKGEIIITIVKDKGFTENDAKKIIKSFFDRFQDSFIIHLEYVTEIERTKQGKYRYIIQKIPDIARF